ncbi:MAG TPA: hypothetical protein VFS08_13715 [Gemmatimonadaceae bacterium]|nr:hypothetical protein [Gemmatimonadaceae bacterium]
MPPLRSALRLTARGATLLLVATGCATTGATFRSGVGDAFPNRPPYYAGAPVRADSIRAGHLPVAYQRGGSQPSFLDPAAGAGSPVAALLAEMSAFLDSLGATTPLAASGAAPGAASAGVPPDVHFGCETDASGDCVRSEEGGALGRGRTTTMRLAVGRPSPEWVASARGAMDAAGVGRALILTLEVGQYWTTQSGLRGDKAVLLGTGHEAPLPWLTSVETPVTVLQLTGALVDRDGQAVRIGAEGLLARRTSLGMSGLGAQALLSDEDVERLRTLRRDDLPGAPLAWQVALRHLVAQLSGRSDVAP